MSCEEEILLQKTNNNWDTVNPRHAGTGHELDEGYKRDSLSLCLQAASKD